MNNPTFERLGIRPQRGNVPPRSVFPPGSTRGNERPLLFQFPGALYLPFYFRNIPLTGETIPAGSAAWYGLASWRIPDDVGQQAALMGYRLELGACNPTPSDDADYAGSLIDLAPWGTNAGTGAALVVGLSLPCTEGQWTAGPASVPYVDVPGAGLNAGKGGAEDRLVFHFPPGKLEDTPQPVTFRSNQSTPLAILLPAGSRLDVALVLRRTYVNAITKSVGILGRCYGELLLASMQTRGEFSE